MSSVISKALFALYLLVLSADYGYLLQTEQAADNDNASLAHIQWAFNAEIESDQDPWSSGDDSDPTGFSVSSSQLVEHAKVFVSVGEPLAAKTSRYQLQPRSTQGPPQYLTA